MKRFLIITVLLIVTPILLFTLEIFLATRGEREEFQNPSNDPRYFGDGSEEITFLVLGDSTSAGQGGDYEKGIAVSSAQYLAETQKKESEVS